MNGCYYTKVDFKKHGLQNMLVIQIFIFVSCNLTLNHTGMAWGEAEADVRSSGLDKRHSISTFPEVIGQEQFYK